MPQRELSLWNHTKCSVGLAFPRHPIALRLVRVAAGAGFPASAAEWDPTRGETAEGRDRGCVCTPAGASERPQFWLLQAMLSWLSGNVWDRPAGSRGGEAVTVEGPLSCSPKPGLIPGRGGRGPGFPRRVPAWGSDSISRWFSSLSPEAQSGKGALFPVCVFQ